MRDVTKIQWKRKGAAGETKTGKEKENSNWDTVKGKRSNKKERERRKRDWNKEKESTGRETEIKWKREVLVVINCRDTEI